MGNKILNLDFSKDPIMLPIIYGRVGDDRMQTITVRISRRDEVPDLTGGTITFEGEPAGGKVKVFDSDNVAATSASLKKGTFDYTFPSAAFSVVGTYQRAYFSFRKDGKRDTTGDFKIIVQGNADIDAEEAETIITEYNKLVDALNEAYQAALTKMGTDYDAVTQRIETIKTQIDQLQTKINKIVSDAEGRITLVEKTVTDALNEILDKLNAIDFYTKKEADERFVTKTNADETFAKKVDVNALDNTVTELTDNVGQVTQSVASLNTWSSQVTQTIETINETIDNSNKIFSRSQEFGYGLLGDITRVGNLVVATCDANQKNGQADGVKNLSEKIPVGFRPAYQLSVKSQVYVGTGYQDTRHHKLSIKPNGTMDVVTKNMSSAPLEILFNVAWVTNDPMPSDN